LRGAGLATEARGGYVCGLNEHADQMKQALSVLFVGVILLTGCHKNEVDIADLTTNPFDPDYTGELALMTVGAIQTEAYAQGIFHKQTVEVRVHPEHFPAPQNYELHFVELTDPSTGVFYSQNTSDNIFNCPNYQITLGTEYCYRIKLVVGGETVR